MFNDSTSGSAFEDTFRNGTLDTGDVVRRDVTISNLLQFCMCVVGLPGNVLVLAVYLSKLTTSTRMYMFALAIADMTVCTCGILVTTTDYEYIRHQINVDMIYMGVAFSVLLLAFISIERLLTVRRPHSFSLSSTRAKRALVVIAVLATVGGSTVAVARAKRYKLLNHMVAAMVIATSVVVMIVCYTLMAITLMLRARAVKCDVGSASTSTGQGPSTVPSVIIHASAKSNPSTGVMSGVRKAIPGIRKITTKQANTNKDVMALLIITVVFLICWIPRWLSDVGFRVQSDLRNLFYLNSAVNPFIYSAVSRIFRQDVRQFFRMVRSRITSCCK